ncbi:MTH865 family protein [Halalkalicoccus tibetensis]|uniref:MTH865 family protein n=1 Tax=Halalkalicoccus tibetensis TaxID=175632 RepID=A0ABD5V3X4_9EURY
MADRDELRSQLYDAFEGADYPVKNQMDLVPALPNGPATKFESGETSFTAMEMATRLSGHQEFPYEDADSLVDDVMTGLEKEDMI